MLLLMDGCDTGLPKYITTPCGCGAEFLFSVEEEKKGQKQFQNLLHLHIVFTFDVQWNTYVILC